MSELSALAGSEGYGACFDDVVAAHLMPLSRGFCACIMVYSVFNVQRKASWRMSLHLSSFLGHFCTLFLSLREKFFDFLHCGADAFGNVLVSDALNPPNFINGHSVNVVHPKSAELCFRQLVPDLRNHRGSHSAPFSFLVLAIHNHINGRNGKCGFGQVINGRIVFPLYHILIVLSAVVSIRPRFPFQKFFLAGKVLAGQADDDFIGVHINDGIGVFLIQRIDAFSIKHFVPPFRSEWVKRPERRAAGSGSPRRRSAVNDKKRPHRHKSLYGRLGAVQYGNCRRLSEGIGILRCPGIARLCSRRGSSPQH